MKDFFAVALGGCAGSICRWLMISSKMNGLIPALPVGTLLVNLLGRLVIAITTAWLAKNNLLDSSLKLLIAT